MNMHWLSILVPVYQVEAYLPACLDAILAQAGEGVEVVLVNDASPDGCATILADYATRYPQRVRVLTHEHNQGISASRNTLLDAARGEYLWFIDSDDLLEPGALASLKTIIDAHAPDLVTCDFRSFDDATGRARKARYAHIPSYVGAAGVLSKDRDSLLQGLFATGRFHPWSKIVRRAIWPPGLRFPVGRVFEDLAVYARLALAVQSHWHAAEVWIAYRQRAGSALATMSPAKLDDRMHALKGYAFDVQGLGLNERTNFAIAHYAARALLNVRKLGQRRQLDEELWASASPLTASQLERAYLRRGRLLRWLQWRFQRPRNNAS